VKPFDAPEDSFGNLDAQTAAQLMATTSDLVLIVDDAGIIRDMAIGSEELSKEGYTGWLGQPWVETVTIESRAKVEALLSGASSAGAPRWRHLNHASAQGASVPLLFSAIRLEKKKRVVAVGRDLRQVAALQQRLVDAQQAMERDYWHLRQAETRYRHLFQMVPDAVLIVDAHSQKVVEANARANQLFSRDAGDVVGRFITDAFSEAGARAIQALMAGVRASGQPDEVRAETALGSESVLVAASMFRQESASLFLLRVATAMPAPRGNGAREQSPRDLLIAAVERMPDGFVVTDNEGLILVANSAFLDLAQVATEDQMRGESLERWLGRSGVDLSVLVANLRQHGSVRLFATNVRGDQGLSTDVEISAVSVPHGKQPCFGFTIRNVGRRLAMSPRTPRESPRSVEQLADLVGRVPLKDLVQESTDLIEKLCIEAALELTRDNRASAAEMLGLSRQSLYVKLRRYGLGDLTSDHDKP
jgi:transcriptional regulator PpsR